MAGCWRVLDPFYSRPTQYVQDLMAEITATRKIQYSEYESCMSITLSYEDTSRRPGKPTWKRHC